MESTAIVVGLVVAALGVLLTWVARATRRPMEPPPRSAPLVVEAERARGHATALADQADELRDRAELRHEVDSAAAAAARRDVAEADTLDDLLDAGRADRERQS